MELNPASIISLANLGIGIVFSILLLNLYSKQSKDIMVLSERREKQLIDLVEKNTAAITSLNAAVTTLQTAVTALCEEVRHDRR